VVAIVRTVLPVASSLLFVRGNNPELEESIESNESVHREIQDMIRGGFLGVFVTFTPLGDPFTVTIFFESCHFLDDSKT
jgi:hypothetical protein